MKLSRIAAVLSAFALTTVLALIGAGTAQASTGGYTALGDSYSAGVGAGSYDSSSGSCSRSTRAYPALWAAANGPSSFTFAACSGAQTSDVLNNQLGSLNSSTSLVSITIGGNDASFSGVMQTCVLDGQTACLNAVATAQSFADNTLPGRLDQVYSAISSKAPNAHVVVLGYPRFYQIGGSCLVGLSDTSRSAIDNADAELDSVIAQRAAAHGFTYGDPNATFTGHEICSGDSWLHSVTIPPNESYHPTATGQASGYLPVFSSAA